jgi:glyoxylase-like metal-dependent hydrolase (beta-lactamase superfamily II)
VADDILLIPLHGHSRGHAAVAVRLDERLRAAYDGAEWLLHAGDAYFHHGEMDEVPFCPPGLRQFQSIVAVDDETRRANAARLRTLRRENGSKVHVFSAHSAVEFRVLEARSRAAQGDESAA